MTNDQFGKLVYKYGSRTAMRDAILAHLRQGLPLCDSARGFISECRRFCGNKANEKFVNAVARLAGKGDK